MTQRINFYDAAEPYGLFSNFYIASILIDGITYPTVEHYFQSQKFLGPEATPRSIEYAKIIAGQSTAGKTKILANQKIKGGYKWVQALNEIIQSYPDVRMRSDWEDVKDNVMRRGVYQKFKQHLNLQRQLLATEDSLVFLRIFQMVDIGPPVLYMGVQIADRLVDIFMLISMFFFLENSFFHLIRTRNFSLTIPDQ